MSRRANETQSRFGDELDDRPSNASMSWLDDETEDDDQIGRVIDNRYQLLSLIGRGGMGSVYKAEHLVIRRNVALKLLHPSLASVPEISRRFEREAFAIGRIGHPNCVDVMDFGKLEDGSLYLVMEFLKGHSLGDDLADNVRVEPGRALHILRHILRGLGHAHENDIVHRDVKPENVVLIEQDGDRDFAKILDFGIAKLMGTAAADDGGVKLTQAGMAFGTPIYMSPEQAVGNPVDGRADLYAASIMGYEMLTGSPPFQSDDKIEIMSMHTTRPVPPMSEVAPSVPIPSDVENLIVRGLAKRPQDRYATANEYIAAIETVIAGGSVMVPIDPMTTGPYGRATTAHPMTTQMTEELAQLQATLHQRQKRSRILIRAGLMIAAVVAIAIAVAMSMSKTPNADPNSLTERAKAEIAKGNPKAAIELLEAERKSIENSPQALFQLGLAYQADREDSKALDQYGKALELDRALAENDKLRANLNLLRDGDDQIAGIRAADLLASRFDDQSARDKLVEMASRGKKKAPRQLAASMVAAHGLSDRVDWVESHMLDLVQDSPCKKRKEAMVKLRASGDKRAIPALKRAAKRKYTRGKRKGRSVNRCFRKDALEAAAHIEALHAEPVPSPTETGEGGAGAEQPDANPK